MCVHTRACVCVSPSGWVGWWVRTGVAVGTPRLCHRAHAHLHKPRVSSPLSPSPRMVVIIFWLLSKYRGCHGNNKTAAISGSGSTVSHCKRRSAGAGRQRFPHVCAPSRGTLPIPCVHTRPCTPTHAGAAGAPGRGQVANTGLGSFYRNREAVAENAFSIEQNKNTLCVCSAQPGELQARGWLKGVICPLSEVTWHGGDPLGHPQEDANMRQRELGSP